MGATPGAVAGIVLAAGSGTRFGRLKQFERLHGKRLVDRAVEFFDGRCDPVVVVLPEAHVATWTGPPIRAAVSVVAGGSSRIASLRAGMDAVDLSARTVIVHDATRPGTSPELIEVLVAAIDEGADAAMPCWPSPDTIKRLRDDGTIEHVGREGYLIGQTPMGYRTSVLRTVLATADDRAVEETIELERMGFRFVPVPGDRWSHHLVDQSDLARFERLLDA